MTDAVRSPSAPGTDDPTVDWHRRVVDRSLRSATQKSIDRGASLIAAAATLLERSDGEGFTVQEVADEAGQSLRTLYQYFESKDDLILALYEETQRAYAGMIRKAIAELDDPLERLAGALMAAARMPERSSGGVGVGMSRLRLKLREVEPELVARSQAPARALFIELYDEVVAHHDLDDRSVGSRGTEQSVYLMIALNNAFITSQVLGNESGLALPEVRDLARFCIQGLGTARDDAWYEAVAARVHLPAGRIAD